jgi:hypothetical protein
MLPDVLAKDAKRRERFRQEARTVAQIRHPNACTLHDIAEESWSSLKGKSSSGASHKVQFQ